MAISIHTNAGALQAIIAAYLLSYGLSQFIYGPLSDYYGRRPIVLIGLIIYLPGAALAWSANSFLMLFLGCLIQGAGIGCGGVMSRAVMRDLFSGKALHRANSVVAMGLSLPPLVAPILGGELSHLFGWRACFAFMATFCLLIWLISLLLYPETNYHRYQRKPVLKNYVSILKNKAFQAYSLCTMQTFAGIALLEVVLGVLLGQRLGFSPKDVSFIFTIPLPGYILGSWLSAKLSHQYERDTIIAVSLVVLILGGITMLLPAIMKNISVIVLLVPAVIYFIAAGMLAPATISGATEPFPNQAGTAGAILGGLQNVGAGMITLLSAWLPQNNQLCLGILMTLLPLIAGSIFIKHLINTSKKNSLYASP